MKKLRKIKAFTLIELLVVVAIIGILAAVGVVAYNGYTSSAKKNAAKMNHNNAIKFINTKFTECNIEGSLQLMSKTNDKNLYSVSCSVSTNSDSMALAFLNHLNNQGFKNPFEPSSNAFTSNTRAVGETWFGVSGNNAGITEFNIITKLDSNTSNNLRTTIDDPRD